MSGAGEEPSGWQVYLATLDRMRERLLARPEAIAHPQVRAQAGYALQSLITGANQLYVHGRTDYPAFGAFWGSDRPLWGAPASDFNYYWINLDGARTYRIFGTAGTGCFTDFQLFSGHYGDAVMRGLGNFDLDSFAIAADGSFEIVLSPEPHDGNWIKLDPSERRCIMQVRDALGDWGAQRPMKVEIELVPPAHGSFVLDEAEMDVRLRKAAYMVEQTLTRAMNKTDWLLANAGVNAFGEEVYAKASDQGANPRAGYFLMWWELAPDEALIIEGDRFDSRYWSLQLYDPWWETLDYTYHQSGLNHTQVRLDADDKYRIVMSFEDPGVPNWLDPLRTPVGQLMMRSYDGRPSAMPTVTKVKAGELRGHLPADTPTVTPAERADALVRRMHQARGRWR